MAVLQERLYLWMLSFFPSFFSSSFFLFFPSSFLSLPVLLRYNWHTALCKFEVYDHNDLTYIHHEMITTLYLVKVYVSYTYKIKEIGTNIFFVMKTLRIHSLSTTIIQQCYPYYAIHYISSIYSSYSWKFVPFDCLLSVLSSKTWWFCF